MCPLIPVMETVPEAWQPRDEPSSIEPDPPPTPDSITRGFLELFEPDVLVETAAGQFERLSRMGMSISNKRRWTISGMVRSDSWRGSYFDAGIGMDTVYEHLHRNVYQFRRRDEPSALLFSGGDPDSRSFFETAYGMFPECERLDRFAESYRALLGAETAVPDLDTWKRIETSGSRYPFSFSNHDVHVEVNYGLPTLFVFDPCAGTDVIELWNSRLISRQVTPFNVRWVSSAKDFFWDIIKRNNKPLAGDQSRRMSTSLYFAASTDIRRVVRILDLLRADKHEGSMSISGHWTLPVSGAQPALIGYDRPAMLSVKREEVQVVPTSELGTEDQNRALVPTLSPEFFSESYMAGPAWVNVTQVSSQAADIFAELVPSNALDEHTPDAPSSLQVQYRNWEGWVTFHNRPHRSASLPLPTMRQAVTRWLARRRFAPRASDAGHVANDLIESVGGLGRTRLLADRETIEFLNNMARSRRGRGAGEDEFPERTASIGQVKAFLSKLKKRRPYEDNDLNRFVDAGALRLGVAVKCPHCTKENWYDLDDVAYVNRCERCLRAFRFPEGTIPGLSNWKYRVVGPFATPNFAQGAYSVALTLSFLKNGVASPWGDFTYATGLELKRARQVREVDFFAWYRQRNIGRFPSPATLIGECKSLGTEAFQTQDIDRLKELAHWFPGAFLVAATLKEAFDPAETDALRDLAEWGWGRGHSRRLPSPLIVLTSRELMCRTHLQSAWREAGGDLAKLIRDYRGAGEPADLSKATLRAYLHFSDFDIGQMAGHD